MKIRLILTILLSGCATATVEQDFLSHHEFEIAESLQGTGAVAMTFLAPIDFAIGDRIREVDEGLPDHVSSFTYDAEIRSVRFATNTNLQGVDMVTMAMRSEEDNLVYAAHWLTAEDQRVSILTLDIVANGIETFKPLLIDPTTQIAITVWTDPSVVTFTRVVHDTVIRVTTDVTVRP